MTRRAWTILVVGALLSASLGGFVLFDRGQASVFKPLASGGMFTSAAWETVKQRVANRGFNAASVRVLTSTGDSQSGKAVTLLGASRPSRASCFIVARGTTLGPSICRLARPVTVFTARDHFYETGPSGQPRSFPATDAIGLIRRDVASVVMSWKILGRSNVQGLPLFEWTACAPSDSPSEAPLERCSSATHTARPCRDSISRRTSPLSGALGSRPRFGVEPVGRSA